MAFNIVDYVVLAVIGVSFLIGIYKGFISSLLMIIAFLGSLLAAYIFAPQISAAIQDNKSIRDVLFYYTDAASRMGAGLSSTSIFNVTADTITNIVKDINLFAPFDAILKSNVANQVFDHFGLTTVGEYVNQTIVTITVNILCYIAVFGISYFIMVMIINMLNAIFQFPILKQLNGLLGGLFGIARGYLLMMLLFALVPLVLTALPIKELNDMINASVFGQHFLNSALFHMMTTL